MGTMIGDTLIDKTMIGKVAYHLQLLQWLFEAEAFLSYIIIIIIITIIAIIINIIIHDHHTLLSSSSSEAH